MIRFPLIGHLRSSSTAVRSGPAISPLTPGRNVRHAACCGTGWPSALVAVARGYERASEHRYSCSALQSGDR